MDGVRRYTVTATMATEDRLKTSDKTCGFLAFFTFILVNTAVAHADVVIVFGAVVIVGASK
jgi:hypothetical protein